MAVKELNSYFKKGFYSDMIFFELDREEIISNR